MGGGEPMPTHGWRRAHSIKLWRDLRRVVLAARLRHMACDTPAAPAPGQPALWRWASQISIEREVYRHYRSALPTTTVPVVVALLPVVTLTEQ